MINGRDKACGQRGESVVRRVLEAVLREIGTVGYGALSMERVAASAGVNKTTVYRRWPTKPELVRAAFEANARERIKDPDTGSLRGDLIEVGKSALQVFRSNEGRAMLRTLFGGQFDSEVAPFIKSMRKSDGLMARRVFERAVARGEILPARNHDVVISALFAVLQHSVMLNSDFGRTNRIEDIVDLLLNGILTERARAQAMPGPRAFSGK